MLDPYLIIKKPCITEKTDRDRKDFNKYTFEVDMNANKNQIKEAIEKLFNVDVMKINTSTLFGKTRSLRSKVGKRPDRKKAIITIGKDQKINIFETDQKVM